MRRLRAGDRYYTEVARGIIRSSLEGVMPAHDHLSVVIYRNDAGEWLCTPTTEFDERFQPVQVTYRHVDEGGLWAYLRLGWHAEYVGERGPGSTYMVSWMRAGDPVEPEEVKHGDASQAGEPGAPTGTPT